MKRTKPAFFPKTPYEGSLLQSLGILPISSVSSVAGSLDGNFLWGLSGATDLSPYDPLLGLAVATARGEITLCARKRDFRGTSISDFFNNIGRIAGVHGAARQDLVSAPNGSFSLRRSASTRARSWRRPSCRLPQKVGRGPGEAIEKYGSPRRRSSTLHSSGIPDLRSPSNANCSTGLCFMSHLTERSGLRRRASAMAAFASSNSPVNAWAAAKLM